MIKNPDINIDVYKSSTPDDFKIKLNAKDVIYDSADVENSFPINLLERFQEYEMLPLIVITAVKKF